MTSQIDRLRVAAALLALAVGVVACSNDTDDALDPGPEPTVTLRTDPPPSTTTTTATPPTTTTTIPATTTVHEPAPPDLPPCTTNMGTTLRHDILWTRGGSTSPQPPEGWEPLPQEGFDWDQDGQPDTLTIGQPDGAVTLTWATGSLTITGLTTQFDQPLDDGVSNMYPGLSKGVADSVRPVSVADVTGDGWLDLIVIDQGTVSILAGAGDATPTGTVEFSAIGTDTLGWTNPPITVELPSGQDEQPSGVEVRMPSPHSSVHAAGGLSNGGSDGVVALGHQERSSGPRVYYDGIHCRAR